MMADVEHLAVTALADRMASAFVHGTRPNGETYIYLPREAPAWMHDLCREAHGDMAPDDWRYFAISCALDYIIETDLPDEDDDADDWKDDACNNWVGGVAASMSTAEKIKWLGSHSNRPDYCDDEAEALSSDTCIIDRIDAGIINEATEVFFLVLSGLIEQTKKTT